MVRGIVKDYILHVNVMSFFQNSVSFEKSSGKIVQMNNFSVKSEVLKKLLIIIYAVSTDRGTTFIPSLRRQAVPLAVITVNAAGGPIFS